jgi:hypothetical protein
MRCGAVDLHGDQNAVAVSDDLAARDLGLVRDNRVELLVADPAGDELRGLEALLRSLEETERARRRRRPRSGSSPRTPEGSSKISTTSRFSLRATSAMRWRCSSGAQELFPLFRRPY